MITMNKPNSSLSQFIEEFPLYSKFGTDQPIEPSDLNNLVFNFFCKSENEVQPFRLEPNTHKDHSNNGSLIARSSPEGSVVDFTELFSGVCQSCVKYRVSIIISGASQKDSPKYFIRKIGQYPAPETTAVKFPEEITYFLNDESRELYGKALKSLENDYGIG